jgi:small GTP-binding protein
LFKILVIGDSGVGKSSILKRLIERNWNEIAVPTLRGYFKMKNIEVNTKKVRLLLWDTAEHERMITTT